MTDVSSLSPTDESYRDELVRSWSEHVSPLACVCVVCAVEYVEWSVFLVYSLWIIGSRSNPSHLAPADRASPMVRMLFGCRSR
jgi:hypothetical protein